MIFRNFAKYIQNIYGGNYREKTSSTENTSSKNTILRKKDKFKPCSSSTPTPCKASYIAKLRSPYYDALKVLKNKGRVGTEEESWSPLTVKPNPASAMPPDGDMEISDEFKKAFQTIEKQRIKLFAKREEEKKKYKDKKLFSGHE